MEEILDNIDKAIKRLVSPTAMVVAAGVLAKGIVNPRVDELAIKMLIYLLLASALLFMASSGYQALRKFETLGVGVFRRFVLSLSFLLVYGVLFLVGIAIAFGKL